MTNTPHTPAAGHSGTPDDGNAPAYEGLTPEQRRAFLEAAKPQTMTLNGWLMTLPRRHKLAVDNGACVLSAFSMGLSMYPGNWGYFTFMGAALSLNLFLHWAHASDVDG